MPSPYPARPWQGAQNTSKRSWPRTSTLARNGEREAIGRLAVLGASQEQAVRR